MFTRSIDQGKEENRKKSPAYNKTMRLSLFCAIFLLVALFCSVAFAEIASGVYDDLSWVLDDEGTLSICGADITGDSGDVSSEKWDNYRADIKKIIFCNGITKIQSAMFSGWTHIEEIVISEGVNEIGQNAFFLCYELKSICLPRSLKHIGDFAFYNGMQIQDVYYGGNENDRSKISIGSDYSNLQRATWHYVEHEDIPEQPPTDSGEWYGLSWTLDIDGLLTINGTGSMAGFSYDSTEAWRPYKFDIKKVVIGVGITNIGGCAFDGCCYLDYVSLPETIASIDYNAFDECEILRSIKIPYSVKTINDCAFYKCRRLSNLVLPNNLETIGSSAFGFCECFEYITIPASVTCMGSGVFSGCDRLKRVELPNGLAEIQNNMFFACYDLDSIYIPKSVKRIGDYAFYSCHKITDVYYGGTEADRGEIELGFDYSNLWEATWHYQVNSANVISLPYDTVVVEEYAFANTVASVYIIPEGTKSLKAYSFMNLPRVEKIYLPTTLNEIDSNTFSGSEHALFICPNNSCYSYVWAKGKGLNVIVE